MACATRKKCNTEKELTSEQKVILEAMAATLTPLACKEIAVASGMESKSVSCKLKSLKNQGYIDSPARCKYAITDSGRTAVATA